MNAYEYIVLYMAIMSVVGTIATFNAIKRALNNLRNKPPKPTIDKGLDVKLPHQATLPRRGRGYTVDVEACERYLASRK